jgi:hypothetical protein
MKVKVTVSLPHDDLDWYRKEYPENTLSATITLLLHNFRSVHRDVGLTPNKAAKDAAKEVKELIDEGSFYPGQKEKEEETV